MASERLSEAMEAEMERLWLKISGRDVPHSARDGYIDDLRKFARMVDGERPKPRKTILGCYPG